MKCVAVRGPAQAGLPEAGTLCTVRPECTPFALHYPRECGRFFNTGAFFSAQPPDGPLKRKWITLLLRCKWEEVSAT
jgi:hypothetical protein